MTSGFRREADGNCTLLSYYVTSSGNLLPTFRDNLSVTSQRVKTPQIDIQITTNKMQSLFIYFYRCSIYLGRFLRPSSGAQNCTHSFRHCHPILLLLASVDEMELSFLFIHAVCTVLCSWWWAEEPPETCRASVEINKSETLHLVGCNLEMYCDARTCEYQTHRQVVPKHH